MRHALLLEATSPPVLSLTLQSLAHSSPPTPPADEEYEEAGSSTPQAPLVEEAAPRCCCLRPGVVEEWRRLLPVRLNPFPPDPPPPPPPPPPPTPPPTPQPPPRMEVDLRLRKVASKREAIAVGAWDLVDSGTACEVGGSTK